MDFIECPECGNDVSNTATLCPHCGSEMEKKVSNVDPESVAPNNGASKKAKNKIVLIVSVAIFTLGVCFGAYFGIAQYNEQKELIAKSKASFQQAQVYEEELEYDLAIEQYSLVIPKDEENYRVAKQKINELQEKKILDSNTHFQQAQSYEEKTEYELALEYYSLVIPEDSENYKIAEQKIIEIQEKQKQLLDSNANFEKAQSYEKELEYDLAIEYYSLVIPEDKKNYISANLRISDIEEKKAYIDNCAKAWIAAEVVCPYFDSKSVSAVYYAENDSPYALLYGEGTVAIISSFLGTDCTFVIAPKLDSTLAEYYPHYYNNEYDMYVHGIGTENYTKGWLSSGYNVVTDTYVTLAKTYCESMDVAVVQAYIDKCYG